MVYECCELTRSPESSSEPHQTLPSHQMNISRQIMVQGQPIKHAIEKGLPEVERNPNRLTVRHYQSYNNHTWSLSVPSHVCRHQTP
ncbi:hypothetical protein Hanom_Chr07g00606651 [Helianthus anomalus]